MTEPVNSLAKNDPLRREVIQTEKELIRLNQDLGIMNSRCFELSTNYYLAI